MLFSFLLGLIAPTVSREIIYLWSALIVITLTLFSPLPSYIIKERYLPAEKRSAFRRAPGVILAIPVPYVVIVIFLYAYNVMSKDILILAIVAFLPIMFFAIMTSSMIANRSQLRDALAAGIFCAGLTAIPLAVAVFVILPILYKIPYVCGLIVSYVTLIYWIRSICAENRRKRERKTSKHTN